MTTPKLGRAWLWGLLVAIVAFTVHGSLVPYNFHPRDLDDAWAAFQWAMNRPGPVSRSDVLANWMLGVPLGFAIVGLAGLDSSTRRRPFQAAVLALPLCLIFSCSVEFAQLYLPERTCAQSDVIAQAVGVLTGYLLWFLRGQWLIDQLRGVAAHPRAGGRHGQRVLLYFLFLIVLQILPADLTLSPKMIYDRFKYGEITLTPFADWLTDAKPPRRLIEAAAHWLLCWPLGYGLAVWPGERWFPRAVLGGLAASFVLEVVQVFVQSRHPSTTEALAGWFGIILGALLAAALGKASSTSNA